MLANNQKDSMTKDQVQAYIDNEVAKLGDSRVKPLVASINNELTFQRQNDNRIAAIQKENEESNKRIAAFQQELGKANKEVNDLAEKLAEATVAAPNTGETTAAAQ
jgi:chromosome segregation ATPase